MTRRNVMPTSSPADEKLDTDLGAPGGLILNRVNQNSRDTAALFNDN